MPAETLVKPGLPSWFIKRPKKVHCHTSRALGRGRINVTTDKGCRSANYATEIKINLSIGVLPGKSSSLVHTLHNAQVDRTWGISRDRRVVWRMLSSSLGSSVRLWSLTNDTCAFMGETGNIRNNPLLKCIFRHCPFAPYHVLCKPHQMLWPQVITSITAHEVGSITGIMKKIIRVFSWIVLFLI